MAPGETRIGIARSIISALKAENAPAVGFINGSWTETEPDSKAVLDTWAESGLPLANHGWSHADLNVVTLEEYRADIDGNEPLLAWLTPAGDWRWFRYPYLREGNDPEKRAAIRSYLAKKDYRIAAVTMDFWDWSFNQAYARCAALGDKAAITKLEEEFLATARRKAQASRDMAKALYGRDIPYVLLLHIGAMDARLMPRLLAMYREMGFDFVTLDEAQRDRYYAADNDPILPGAPWTLEGKMQAAGLPLPETAAPVTFPDTVCNAQAKAE
jgi:peptidoglycan/xylan/chitin deacetylase (PgdA/CDA1 family)